MSIKCQREVSGKKFDVLILGGGITGAGILYELTSRGLKCILIEKNDFSSGTSSKSSKLIHGGLRYLQYFKIRLVHSACVERFKLLKYVAPHIVSPIKFIIPAYSYWKKFLYFCGVLVYNTLSYFYKIGGIKLLSGTTLKTIVPELKTPKGGVSYFDCKALDFRLVIDTLKSAHEEGACLINYCDLKSIKSLGDSYLVNLIDQISNKSFQISCDIIINATGPWVDDVLKVLGSEDFFRLKKTSGINVILKIPNFSLKYAVAFESIKDGRNLFAIPWNEYILVGTTDKVYEGDIDAAEVRTEDIRYLIESFSYYFNHLDIKNSYIHSCFVGIRPLMGSDKDVPEYRLSRDFSIKIDKRIVSIAGGKLTTYRHMAKVLADKIVKKFFPYCKRNHAIKSISGASSYKSENGYYKRLFALYGANASIILEYLKKDSSLSKQLCPCCPIILAEIAYLVDYEFVQKLSDVFMRRTELFLFGNDNGLHIVEPVSDFIGAKLGWTEKRRINEIEEYCNYVFKMRKVIEGL